MQTTVNVHLNRGIPAEEHTERKKALIEGENIKYTNNLIDLNNTFGKSFHEVLYRSNLTDKYSELFGAALDEYNANLKRKDRQITMEDYMNSIVNDTRGKRQTKSVNGKRVVDASKPRGKRLSYEVIICVGNTECAKDENGMVIYDENNHQIFPEYLPRDLQTKIIRRYCMSFAERNPNLGVANIDIHGDEMFQNRRCIWEYGDIHAHIEFIPFASGFKQSLRTQNSMNKALDAMNIKYKQGEQPYDLWCKKERKYLEEITQEEFSNYRIDHPDFGGDGEELIIYHPVADKMRQGGLEKELYAFQKEMKEEAAEFDFKKNEIEKSSKEAAAQAAELKRTSKREADDTVFSAKIKSGIIIDEAEDEAKSITSKALNEADEMKKNAQDEANKIKKQAQDEADRFNAERMAELASIEKQKQEEYAAREASLLKREKACGIAEKTNHKKTQLQDSANQLKPQVPDSSRFDNAIKGFF